MPGQQDALAVASATNHHHSHHNHHHHHNNSNNDVVDNNEQQLPNTSSVPQQPQQLHDCELCGRRYKSRTSLNAHLKSVHKIGCSVPKIACHFDHCAFKCYKLNQLINHLTEQHQFSIQFVSLSFYSKEDFLKWKHEEEKRENCFWYHSKSYKLSDNYVDVFSCNRSGHPKVSVRERKRQLKAQGYNKCGNICISHLRLTHFFRSKKPKTYHLSYLKTHSGHNSECIKAHDSLLEEEPQGTSLARQSMLNSEEVTESLSRMSNQTSLAELSSVTPMITDNEPDEVNPMVAISTNGCTGKSITNAIICSLPEKSIAHHTNGVQLAAGSSSVGSSLIAHPMSNTITIPIMATNAHVFANAVSTNSSSNGPTLTMATNSGNYKINSALNTLQMPITLHTSPVVTSSNVLNASNLQIATTASGTTSNILVQSSPASREVLNFHNYAAKPPSTKEKEQHNQCFLIDKPNVDGSYFVVLKTDNSMTNTSGSSSIGIQSSSTLTTPAQLLSSSTSSVQSNLQISKPISAQIFINGTTTPTNDARINGTAFSTQSPLQRQSEIVRQRVKQHLEKILNSSLLLHQLNELDQFLGTYIDKHCSR